MEPVRAGGGTLTAGYIFSLLGGIIGIAIGASLLFGKVKNEVGSRVHKYDEPSRGHGKAIMFIGVVMSIVWKIVVQNM